MSDHDEVMERLDWLVAAVRTLLERQVGPQSLDHYVTPSVQDVVDEVPDTPVPEPVCQIRNGNSLARVPSMTSRAARSMKHFR